YDHGVGRGWNSHQAAELPHRIQTKDWIFVIIVRQTFDRLPDANRVLERERGIRIVAKGVAGQCLDERAVAAQLIVRRKNTALQLVRREAFALGELPRVLDQLLDGADLVLAFAVGVAEKKIARELHLVANLAAEQLVKWQLYRLAH